MTVNAILQQGSVFRTAPLTQYDEGQKIHLSGVELPASYLAEFANSESGTAEQIAQTTDTVTIPDNYLTSGNPVYVWIVVVGEDERTTRYEIIVPVRGRGEPDDYTPTPEEQTAIEAAIAALNSAVEAAGVAIEHYPRITDGVWQVWDVTNGAWVSTGVSAIGEDGVSPTVSVSAITGGHRLTITDADGDHVFDVMDGEPGQPGYSPTASVSKSGNTATITITDQQGTTTATVTDGENGQPGPGVPAGGTDGQMLVKDGATDYATKWANTPTAPVTDVQVNGTSVVNQGVANVPVATNASPGVVSVNYMYGVDLVSGSLLGVSASTANEIKLGAEQRKPIAPYRQHESTFFGLAKAANDSTQSASSNAVGTYTEAAKSAISQMLDAPETVSGSTPSIAAKSGVRYVCGECATLAITLPASGDVEVIFESGSTATVLTVTPPSGVTAIKWPGWFDPNDLDANAVYDMIFTNGELAVVTSWT